MSNNKEGKTLITAALPYANGPIHIGHLAGAYLPSDIYARYLRLKGEEVLFICGSDEHGAAITLRAKKEGKSPKEIVDLYHNINKKAFSDFGISFDIFHRTSEPIHHKTAQDFFTTLDEKGEFEIKRSEQFYDEEYNQFLADRYITGTCPKCKYELAYGDQCENCGSSLSPNELINPISTLSGKSPILKETEHWYLPMEKHENWLRRWIEDGILDNKKLHDPKFWRKQVIGQCKSWIDGGLKSRAMTRDLDWGVKVPNQEDENKVLYVWLDAPIGYISATKAWCKENNKEWKDYWQSENTRLLHFIGKDNIVFHCIIFPILLKTHGDFILPENVIANEFLNLEGKKISTSRNWAVWLHEYIESFPERGDTLRYVLTSIAPETKDSEFTWKDFQARNNNELVAIYGNFINRVLVLTQKYYKGIVPTVNPDFQYLSIKNEVLQSVKDCSAKLDQFQFRDAQASMLNIARIGNKFLADEEPWKKIKTSEKEVESIMNTALQIAANLAIASLPFLPETSAKLLKLLNIEDCNWASLKNFKQLKDHHIINEPTLLFSNIEDTEVEAQQLKLDSNSSQSNTNKKYLPMKSEITFDDFQKIDLRIGKILSAEKVEKSSKLLKLEVDLGFEKRIILSGIAKHYNPEDLIGKLVQVVINLSPRKIMGIESQGMILMAESEDGTLSLIAPDKTIDAGDHIS